MKVIDILMDPAFTSPQWPWNWVPKGRWVLQVRYLFLWERTRARRRKERFVDHQLAYKRAKELRDDPNVGVVDLWGVDADGPRLLIGYPINKVWRDSP